MTKQPGTLMTNNKTKLATDAVLYVPEEVCVCPYCGSKLYVQFSQWTQNDDGTWRADGVDMECYSEPELSCAPTNKELRDYNDWGRRHFCMPYLYWTPATMKVEKWVNKNFYFEVDE